MGVTDVDSIPVTNNNGDNIAVVLDEDDVTSTDTTTELKSVNLITGTTVGTWIVVPELSSRIISISLMDSEHSPLLRRLLL